MKEGQNVAEKQGRKEEEEDGDAQCMHGIC